MTEWNKPYPPPPGWKGDEVDAAIGRAVSTAPSCSYDHYDAREIFSAGLATTDDPGRQFLVDELNRLTGENVTLRSYVAALVKCVRVADDIDIETAAMREEYDLVRAEVDRLLPARWEDICGHDLATLPPDPRKPTG